MVVTETSKRISFDGYSLALILIVLPPVLPFMPGALTHYSPIILLIVFCSFYLLAKRSVLLHKEVSLILLALFLLSVASTMVAFAIKGYPVIADDLTDFIRLVGILLIFTVGYNIGVNSVRPSLIVIFLAVCLFRLYVWLAGLESLNNFYGGQSHRFSGFTASINYMWFPLCVGYLIISESVKHNRLGGWILLAYLIVCLISIFLAGSRTSFLAFMLGVLAYYAVSYSLAKSVVWICISGLAIYLSLNYVIESEIGFVSRVDRFSSLLYSADYESFGGENARLELWKRVWTDHVVQNVFMGSGPAKSVVRYTDNSYLMTLFRYGILGLLVELTLYFYLLRKLLAASHYNKAALTVGIPIMLAYFFSGLTSVPFYETTVPYVLFLLLGALISPRKRAY